PRRRPRPARGGRLRGCHQRLGGPAAVRAGGPRGRRPVDRDRRRRHPRARRRGRAADPAARRRRRRRGDRADARRRGTARGVRQAGPRPGGHLADRGGHARAGGGGVRGAGRDVKALVRVGAMLIAVGGLAAMIPRPAAPPVTEPADSVIVAGAAGLRWDDVNATDTPTMWQLALHGSIGALSVRSARRVTCSGDGWLTLGAGNLARYTTAPVTQQCPPLDVEIDRPSGPTDGASATLPELRDVVNDNRTLPWRAEP